MKDVYYHVTTDEHVYDILDGGLIPFLGERSIVNEESQKAIYLFSDEVSKDDALMNWLGDVYSDYEGKLHSVIVELPDWISVENTTDWEVVCYEHIPPEHITYNKCEG